MLHCWVLQVPAPNFSYYCSWLTGQKKGKREDEWDEHVCCCSEVVWIKTCCVDLTVAAVSEMIVDGRDRSVLC